MTIFYYDVYAGSGQIQVPSDAAAIVAKATEGTYYRDSEFSWFKQQAANRNLPFSGYHFLNGNEDPVAQAKYYFDFAGATPCMVDVEPEDSANSKPTVDQTVAFINALRGLGGHVWSVYFPQWYWNEVGGDLSRLTALRVGLVSSNYTSYSDSGPGWLKYGGAPPIAWQFTSTPLDKNAFNGTPAELAAIINGDTMEPVDVWGWRNPTLDTIDMRQRLVNAELASEQANNSIGVVNGSVGIINGKIDQILAHLASLTTGGTVSGAPTAQQNAAELLAELKAKL